MRGGRRRPGGRLRWNAFWGMWNLRSSIQEPRAGSRAGTWERPGSRRLDTAGTGLALAGGWVSMPAAGMGGLGHREPLLDSRRVLV